MEQVLRGRSRRHTALTWISLVSASVGISALLLHAAGLMPMYFLVDLLGPPSLVLLAAAAVYAYHVDERVFFNRLVTGAWAGLVATVCYDAVRLALWKAGFFHFNPFMTHPVFGTLITRLPVTSEIAIWTGWAYHFWNGFTFGIMYTLVAGSARWHYGVVWALILEIGWLTALPSVLHLHLNWPIITLSMIGHAAYGSTLGLLSQRFARS